MENLDTRGQIAKAIAVIAHSGQKDKAGQPYIGHPERVAARLTDSAQVATAWLHDVLEDTFVTAEDLREAGMPEHVVEAVVLLTRTTEAYTGQYYDQISKNTIARKVKLADIDDNTDPARLALLDDETIVRLVKKYAKAREALGVKL